jgi:hypothetical protein
VFRKIVFEFLNSIHRCGFPVEFFSVFPGFYTLFCSISWWKLFHLARANISFTHEYLSGSERENDQIFRLCNDAFSSTGFRSGNDGEIILKSEYVMLVLVRNEVLHNLYSSPSIIRMIKSRRVRWAGHVARMGEERNAYRILLGKPEGKSPLGRTRRKWVDNIKMDLREIGWDSMDWIDLTQDRDTAMNLRAP